MSPQALPYVCLLIAMLFFIYAIIGMQVGAPDGTGNRRGPWALGQKGTDHGHQMVSMTDWHLGNISMFEALYELNSQKSCSTDKDTEAGHHGFGPVTQSPLVRHSSTVCGKKLCCAPEWNPIGLLGC